MKWRHYISLSIAALTCLAFTGQPLSYRFVPNDSFQEGELLEYRVHYGFITAGYATLQVKEKPVIVNERPCYHVVGIGRSSSSFDMVFKVRDRYESFIDQESLIPWQFNRHIVEGGFESYTETRFDHLNNTAYYTDEKKRINRYWIPENIQDVVSAFYFARTYDHTILEPGDQLPFQNFLDRQTFDLNAEFVKRETIKVNGKKYKALKMKLNVEEAGMVTDGGVITFWITDDSNKIPLRIESELMIGSIKADLHSHQNLRHPLTSLIRQ